MTSAAVRVENLHKSYRLGKVDLHVLRGVSFDVPDGQFVAIVGASGSGKSTLLHLIGLLDRPDKGQVTLEGIAADTLSSARRNAIRCRDVGFVFQFYHLLGELTVLENVLLAPMTDASISGWLSRRSPSRKAALDILDRLGLSGRLYHKPKELSGGERQRVAIARALINNPKVLLADEPTGNLDSRTGREIIDVLREFNKKQNQTILMVTHDQSLAAAADRVLHLRDGKLNDTK